MRNSFCCSLAMMRCYIKEELQELFGKPVDIVRLRKNMNPMLLKQIERDGILYQLAPPET